MRTVVISLAAGLTVFAAPVLATEPAAPAATPAAAPAFSTATTDLGTLMDNPATRAVLDKYIAPMLANEQIAMARPMTLKMLQQYAGEVLTDETLAKIDADLAKVPAK